MIDKNELKTVEDLLKNHNGSLSDPSLLEALKALKGNKIFSIELPIEQIKLTQTEKEESTTQDKEVTMKNDEVSLKLKASPELLKEFIRGEKVRITVLQPQTQLPTGD